MPRDSLHYNTEERLNRYCASISENDKISPENKQLILRFYALCRAQSLSNSRLAKTLWMMRNIGTWMGTKNFAEATKEDIVDLVNVIHSKYTKAATIQDYKTMLKKFYRWMVGDGTRAPPAVAWLKIGSGHDQKVDPATILTEEDVLQLIQAQNPLPFPWTRNRNKAVVAFLFDSGVRVGELLGMRVRDLKIGGELWYATVRGKTGQRTFPIFTCIPYLKDYLTIHPRPRVADAYIWCRFQNPEEGISYTKLTHILRQAFKRAGVSKRHNPHNFRHSAVTRDSAFMSDQQLKKKYGWTSSSRQLSTYSHVRLEDLEDRYRERYGLARPQRETTLLSKPCPICGAEIRPHEQFCSKCRRPTGMKELVEDESRRQALVELAAELLNLLAQENPGVKTKFRELVEKNKLQHLVT